MNRNNLLLVLVQKPFVSLQDTVTSKNSSKIAQLIKVNRDNLNTVAKILGVSLK
jgi:hypothetical protein